jgi:hypothetical protein
MLDHCFWPGPHNGCLPPHLQVQRGAKLPHVGLRIFDGHGNMWRRLAAEPQPQLLHLVDGLRVSGKNVKLGKFVHYHDHHSLLVVPYDLFIVTGAPGQTVSLHLGLKPPKQQGGRQQDEHATPGGAAQQTQAQVLQQVAAAGMPVPILSQFRLPAMHSSIDNQRWEELGCLGDAQPGPASQPSASHASGAGQQQRLKEQVRVYILDNSGYLRKYHPQEEGPWVCDEPGLLESVAREGHQVVPLVGKGGEQHAVVLPNGRVLRSAAGCAVVEL